MRRLRGFSFLLFVLMVSSLSFLSVAQSQQSTATELPPVLVAGLEAYKAKGPDEAVKIWIKGSALEGSKEAQSQGTLLRQIQDFYGNYESYDVIESKTFSPRSKMFYVVINFEKGPVFAKFEVFRTAQGWILTSFLLNTKEAAVLPSSYN